MGRPGLANQFATELLDAFFDTLKKFTPQLGPGAAERIDRRIHELEDGA